MLKSHLLSFLIGLSGIGSLLVSITHNNKHPHKTYLIALAIMLGCLFLAGNLYWNFDPLSTGLQFQENYLWIAPWNIQYAVGVDGLSLGFILLTVVITFLIILTTKPTTSFQSAPYLSQFLLIQSLLIGSFAATDAMFFYVCWEALLIPILLTIGVWGSQKRAYASIKFFIYTFLGSSGLLIALIYLGSLGSSTNFTIQNFYLLPLTRSEQLFIFTAFFIAFTIKIPLWPLHTWLPDAHTEAPTGGSIILSGLMLKLGGYGLIRFCLPIVPDASRECALFVCILSLIAIIYAGLIAIIQTDMKRLVAYSSISHMGIVVLGIFLALTDISRSAQTSDFSSLALEGAFIQMIAHALSTAGLFLNVGFLYRHFNSRKITDYQGIAAAIPLLANTTFLFILSTIGFPGTGGFVGECLILISAVHTHFWLGSLAILTLILSATYGLWFYGRVFWGELQYPTAPIPSLTFQEKLALTLLVITILSIGIWPMPYLNLFKKTLENLSTLSLQSKL